MEFLDSVWPVVTFFVVYTGFIFGGLHWMLKAQITPVKDQITSVKDQITVQIAPVKDQITSVKDQITVQITPVKELLSNHISDTNKKIDKLSDRFDKQSDRFDKLYDFLMQQKIIQKSGQQQK